MRSSTRPSPSGQIFLPNQPPRHIIGLGGNEGADGSAGGFGTRGDLDIRRPLDRLTLNTVSTDDAYVNGHVTFVAARVSGQIARVLVDDNNRIHKGDVLAQLDQEPYEVVVAEKRAAVETAKADLQAGHGRGAWP